MSEGTQAARALHVSGQTSRFGQEPAVPFPTDSSSAQLPSIDHQAGIPASPVIVPVQTTRGQQQHGPVGELVNHIGHPQHGATNTPMQDRLQEDAQSFLFPSAMPNGAMSADSAENRPHSSGNVSDLSAREDLDLHQERHDMEMSLLRAQVLSVKADQEYKAAQTAALKAEADLKCALLKAQVELAQLQTERYRQHGTVAPSGSTQTSADD